MKILLTNDDGIYARGLNTLYEELSKEHDCLIVAPEIEQSAVGHAITLFRPLVVRSAIKGGKFLGYAVCGTPADCVKLGIRELAKQKPELVISGINRGANCGNNLIYSGTVSAATEAAMMGVPSMAVSLDSHQEADFSFAARFARKMVQMIRENKLLQESALNVNIPCLPEEKISGVVVVEQGKINFFETFEKRIDPRNNIYYWISGETLPAEKDLQTDIGALSQGYITITPIQYDLTRHEVIGKIQNLCKGLDIAN
ncbi:MAG TPA: 5'/3'-nucleotidase SurE [Smithella sp.]|jgi:5'-nucleotidase|nr:5'/3'-nucleotidase SurE [Smithellaceae bacterium]HQM44546.1 5'/3'-nucleotidase SurE [Smithellaceae bacterium]HQP42015.1 5'/3'-nucleotidase SurE [Smithella sp.]